MVDSQQLTLHTLTLRQLADAEQAAEVNGLPTEDVQKGLDDAVERGEAMAARGQYMITPDGRAALDALYPEVFADLRSSDEVSAAMDDFEAGVNRQLLSLTTQWQTVEVNGESVTNDHSDADYDEKTLSKIGRVLDKTRKVLEPLRAHDGLVDRFADRLSTALARAEGGETDYISGVRVDSVHTIWFQMHEHILRLTGRERPE